MSDLSTFLDSGPPQVTQESTPTTPPIVMDQSPDILAQITERTVAPDRNPHPMEGRTATKYGEEFNRALAASPEMRAHWTPEIEHKTENSMAQAIWESAKRDSFIGNIARWADQQIEETQRNTIDEDLIWGAKEELTHNISPEYHSEILNAPTLGLALREADRIRHREEQIRREHHQSIGKTLTADIAGFIIDPTNLLPGYGMLKGVQVAKRMNAVTALRTLQQSTKMQQIAALTTAGAFEEAIRMAPRWASDPTYETNNYMEGIVMSAAFSGLLPAAFGGIAAGARRGADILPNAMNDINASLHAYGVDVGVRQAMRFPGQLKETGFKDPGTALRKSKEAAQDAVNTKVKEVNARTNTRQFNDALTQDMAGDAPSNNKIVSWIDDQLDKAGNTALDRAKLKLRRAGVSTAATLGAAAVGGPLAGITTAALFANKDYLAIAAKVAIRKKNIRRAGYDAAITAGDTKRATDILRETRQSKGQTDIAMTIDVVEEQIASAVDKAKVKLRTINEQSRVCT